MGFSEAHICNMRKPKSESHRQKIISALSNRKTNFRGARISVVDLSTGKEEIFSQIAEVRKRYNISPYQIHFNLLPGYKFTKLDVPVKQKTREYTPKKCYTFVSPSRDIFIFNGLKESYDFSIKNNFKWHSIKNNFNRGKILKGNAKGWEVKKCKT